MGSPISGTCDAAFSRVRDAFAETRAALETILAHLGGDRGGEAAERAADLLRSLRRF